ncbi:unnamed protein product [Eruca vesicaria subsp. sativa]|uniref:Uncharacterized protein n=1 Tax=Eruca vesicaria subsp. sativa TaxID=29727 RepID=A0ABC8JR67_ERUVS|nr:unnamed protein product [Eruca vesicaria subsp. sativa]
MWSQWSQNLLIDLRKPGSRSFNNIGFRSTPASPAHRNQSVATKAAAQRLAKVMALQHKENHDYDDNDDADEDDHEFKFAAPSTIINGISNVPVVPFAGRNRSPSHAISRNVKEKNSSVRSSSTGRPSTFGRSIAPTSSPLWMPHKASLRPQLDPPFKDRDNRRYGEVPIVT